jgi:hypothetical protein
MTEELGVEGQNNFSAVADIHGNAGLFSPAVRDDSVNSYDPGISMKCQRCLSGKEARYRAYTDVMEIDICRTWVAEAQHLGISLALSATKIEPVPLKITETPVRRAIHRRLRNPIL